MIKFFRHFSPLLPEPPAENQQPVVLVDFCATGNAKIPINGQRKPLVRRKPLVCLEFAG
jgi:hypothetical protein